jgi:hypothetical protein
MIKQLAIKLGLWEEAEYVTEITEEERLFFLEAQRHHCRPCRRWFGDTRGKLMHDRHRHKEALKSLE